MDDAPPPDDIDDVPESMADIAEETFETFSRGYIGEGADAQGDMAEVIGEKIEKRLKELYPEKTDEKCIELTMIVIKGLTHWIVLAEEHGQN